MHQSTKHRKSAYDRSFFLLLGVVFSLGLALTAFRWASPGIPAKALTDSYEHRDVLEFVDLATNREIEKRQPPIPKAVSVAVNPLPDPDPEPDPDPLPAPDPEPDPGYGEPGIKMPVDEPGFDDEPFITVEEMPEYPGGEQGLLKDISKGFRIPAIDLEMGVQGTIYVSFVVDKAGEITRIKIIRGISPASDAEAIRVLSGLKRWTPGKQRGKVVSVIYNIPIHIQLR